MTKRVVSISRILAYVVALPLFVNAEGQEIERVARRSGELQSSSLAALSAIDSQTFLKALAETAKNKEQKEQLTQALLDERKFNAYYSELSVLDRQMFLKLLSASVKTREQIEQVKKALLDERKFNAYYSDSPSLYGFSRGLLTLIASPGNIIWTPCQFYKWNHGVWEIVFSPVIIPCTVLGSLLPIEHDLLEGICDIITWGHFGDSSYLEDGYRPWLYKWLSEPALIDRLKEDAEDRAAKAIREKKRE